MDPALNQETIQKLSPIEDWENVQKFVYYVSVSSNLGLSGSGIPRAIRNDPITSSERAQEQRIN